MKFVLNDKMKFRNLLILCFAYLRLMFVATKKTSTHAEEDDNFERYQHVEGKKIHFTGNSAQYLKFNVKVPYLLDFAMCTWYKPEIILEHNILFTYGNKDRQLILWKIKKKQNVPIIMLKIFDTIIMEEKMDGLSTGQWHHLCQYWHGSIGLWALFYNNYIVSFGYRELMDDTTWFISTENATATINHPRTKKTLHGEIYGFHLMSTSNIQRLIDDPVNLLLNLHKSNPSASLSGNDRSTSSPKPTESKLRKRQAAQPVEPTNPEVRPPFFRIRNFFKFIRRMVSFVAVPVIRFAQRLVMPWRRKFVRLRPTTSAVTPSSSATSATEIITNFRAVTENSTTTIEISAGKNKTESVNDLAELEESIVIYETEAESSEPRPLRNTEISNTTLSSPTTESSQILIQQAESNNMQSKYELDKCSTMEMSFAKLNVSQAVNFVTTSTESPPDAITHLGTHLQFMQILYNCCTARRPEVLISWTDTRAFLNNVVIEEAAGCGNF